MLKWFFGSKRNSRIMHLKTNDTNPDLSNAWYVRDLRPAEVLPERLIPGENGGPAKTLTVDELIDVLVSVSNHGWGGVPAVDSAGLPLLSCRVQVLPGWGAGVSQSQYKCMLRYF